MKLNVDYARAQIAKLLSDNPELADDDVLKLDMIEGCTNALELVDGLLDRIANTKMLIDGLSLYAKDLEARQARLRRRHVSLRSLLLALQSDMGRSKLERPLATCSIRAGVQRVLVAHDCDTSKIPDDCVVIKRELDLKAIKGILQRGMTVDGCTLSNKEPVLVLTFT